MVPLMSAQRTHFVDLVKILKQVICRMIAEMESFPIV